MSALGVLFAVESDIVDKLRNMDMDERPEYISEELEELYFEDYPERTYELDKSWEAMHRVFTDGRLEFDCEGYPLGLAILGGEKLYYDEEHDDYIITAKSPEQVKQICDGLCALTDEQIRDRYFGITDENYADFKSEEDFEYVLEYLHDSIPFWRFAAKNGLWVLFTADQ